MEPGAAQPRHTSRTANIARPEVPTEPEGRTVYLTAKRRAEAQRNSREEVGGELALDRRAEGQKLPRAA